MNNIFFLIPFVLVASIGIANAEVGYDYTITENPDGSGTWTSHHPYIFDGENYVPFIHSANQVQTATDTVILNSDGSYSWTERGITDKIVAKYADISDLNTWTYLNTLNNDTPDNSWNGQTFVSSKIKTGVGQLDYKYTLDELNWKTELEATNLTVLTTKVFGFDEIIDLNTDTIMFGGQERNLDNFNGQTFNKTWLANNKGKVIDFLNGLSFDFDKGFENLYAVTVIDTGANSSRLVFDYRMSEPLLPGQKITIDPTFGPSTGNSDNMSLYSTGTCSTFNTVSAGESAVGSTGANCFLKYAFWNTTSIPDTVTITNSSLAITLTQNTNSPTIEVVALKDYPKSVANSTNWDNIRNNATVYTSFVGSASFYYDLDLGATGDSDITDLLVNDWFAVGFRKNPELMENKNLGISNTGSLLTITYTLAPPPDAVTDLTSANLSTNSVDLIWTQPGLNGGTLQGYLINFTSPHGTPETFLANTTNVFYNVTGLAFGTDYSFRVSAATQGGYNGSGNILNITTTSNTYSTPPVLTAFGPSAAPTQINLEFPSSTMQNINGYRIQRETPIGTGWVTIVSNTTTATQFYNNTGLTSNIIYNYRVYAMNNTGISTVSNTYDMTTFHLPDAVTDLTGSATDLSTIDLSWSAPTSYAPEIEGYMINGTTPEGEPVDILNANTGSTATTATALNLLIGQEYSFRVSPITVHGKNASGNIWNGSTIQTFVIGNLSNPDITNDDDFSIFFDRTDLNSSAIQLDVTYPNSYNLSCDFDYKYARINQTYSGLSTVPSGTDDQVATFTLINATGDLVQVRCWDVLTGDESTYVITITSFPFLEQVNELRNGTYGTFFQIGAFDGVMLVVIFLGMIGLNRTTPIVGIVFVVITTLVMSYFQLITYPIIMYPALIMMIVWAFVTTRKDD